jgi:hypothetical protein
VSLLQSRCVEQAYFSTSLLYSQQARFLGSLLVEVAKELNTSSDVAKIHFVKDSQWYLLSPSR